MKSLLESRTVWLAITQAVVSVLIVVFTELDMVGVVLVLKSVVDLFLRADTTTTIYG